MTKLPVQPAPICSNCTHYWNRRGRCAITPDPEDVGTDREKTSPGRLWSEPDSIAPPWCPGFEARPGLLEDIEQAIAVITAHGGHVVAGDGPTALQPVHVAVDDAGLRRAVDDALGPIPMILLCPECGERHVDGETFASKIHHTHACQECGHTWRPAVVPTVGVRFLPGFKDEHDDAADADAATLHAFILTASTPDGPTGCEVGDAFAALQRLVEKAKQA